MMQLFISYDKDTDDMYLSFGELALKIMSIARP